MSVEVVVAVFAAFVIGLLIGGGVMFLVADRAIDSAFDEWEATHPKERHGR